MSTINLLPERYVQQRYQHKANVLCIILFAVVMTGVGIAAVVANRTNSRTQQKYDEVCDAYAEAAKLMAQMKRLEANKRKIINKVNTTSSLLERVPRSYLLAIISQALPEKASLTKVHLMPKRTTTTGQQGTVGMITTVEIIGRAATDVEVADFITNLMKSQLLKDVELAYSQDTVLVTRNDDNTRTKTHVREFRVTSELRPNVDVIDLIKPKQVETAEIPFEHYDTEKSAQGAKS